MTCLRVIRNVIVYPDKIEFIRKRKSLDTCRQSGHGLHIGQCVQCIGAILISSSIAIATAPHASENPTISRHCSYAKLTMKKPGKPIPCIIGQAVVHLYGLHQQPTPTFAVTRGTLVAQRQMVIYWVVLFINRCTYIPTGIMAITVSLLIIRQFRCFRQILQPPRPTITTIVHDHIGEIQTESSGSRLVSFVSNKTICPPHKLKRANTIPLRGVHLLATASVMTSSKLAGDHKSIMRTIAVTASRSNKQTPVIIMNLYHLLSEIIYLIFPPEPGQAPDGFLQIFTHSDWVIFSVQRQLTVQIIGVLEITVLLLFLCLSPGLSIGNILSI